MSRLADLRSVVRDDEGISLVEMMLAIAILGVVSGGLMWGLLGFVKESFRIEERSDANRVLVAFTEAVRVQAPYLSQTCPAGPGETSTPYDPTPGQLAAWGVDLPSGWDASTIDVIAPPPEAFDAALPIRYWDPDASAFVPMPTGDSPGEIQQCARILSARLQQITVRVTSPDGRATETMAVVKRGS